MFQSKFGSFAINYIMLNILQVFFIHFGRMAFYVGVSW